MKICCRSMAQPGIEPRNGLVIPLLHTKDSQSTADDANFSFEYAFAHLPTLLEVL